MNEDKNEDGIRQLMKTGLGYDDACIMNEVFWKYFGTRNQAEVMEKFQAMPREQLVAMDQEIKDRLSKGGLEIAVGKLNVGQSAEIQDKLNEKPPTNEEAIEKLMEGMKINREFAEEFVEKFYQNGTMPTDLRRLSPFKQMEFDDYMNRLRASGWKSPNE
ncbi:hypothetical protein SEA_GUEY18_14 [Gordonia phage Guey18]|nr:hypothetical protein SEA_GUEY18_14 [Gordonia phage Guey18]